MADKYYRAATMGYFLHLAQALLLKFDIPDRQNFIHQQYFRLQMRGYGKTKTCIHTTGVMLGRCIQEFLDAGKFYNLVELRSYLGFFHPENRTAHEDVLSSGQLRVESCSHFQQTAHPSPYASTAMRGLSNPGKNLEESTFPGSVPTYNAENVATLDFKVDIFQRPDVLRFGPRTLKQPKWSLQHVGQHVAQGQIAFAATEPIVLTETVYLDS